MANFCLRCGHNFEFDPAIRLGDFEVEIGQGLFWKGEEIELTPTELSFVHSLMSFPGRFIDHYVLLGRAGSESYDADPRVARVAVAKTRRAIMTKMSAAGAPEMLESRAHFGTRWRR
jgi:DNA-binding response OmpR family regulator